MWRTQCVLPGRGGSRRHARVVIALSQFAETVRDETLSMGETSHLTLPYRVTVRRRVANLGRSKEGLLAISRSFALGADGETVAGTVLPHHRMSLRAGTALADYTSR